MAETNLTVADIQAIADAVTLSMLSLPREVEQVVRPHMTLTLALDPLTKSSMENLMLRITTDADGLFMEFTMHGQIRLAMLRFNYRGWAWTQPTPIRRGKRT